MVNLGRRIIKNHHLFSTAKSSSSRIKIWMLPMVSGFHLGVEPKRMLKPPNHPFSQGFPLFSPSILVVFPLFLETPISKIPKSWHFETW